MAVYDLRRVQLGKQTTWGMPVATTALLRGIEDSEFEEDLATHVVDELGISPGGLYWVGTKTSGGKTEGVMTYEQILYYLHGLLGAVAPSGTEWTYTLPASTPVTPQIYTLHYGMNDAPYQISNALVSKLTISGEAGEDVKVSAEWIAGDGISPASMSTVSISDPEPVTMNHASIFVDAFDGTIGTTQMQGVLASFELEIDPGRHIKKFEGGVMSYGDSRWEGTLTMTLEYTGAAKTLVESALSSLVARQVQLSFASGSKAIDIQLGGIITESIKLFDDRDGNATVEVTMKLAYCPALGTALKVIVDNGMSTLP